MKSIIVAIDIGTTNVKCVVANRALHMLGQCQSEYETHCVGVAWFEQNPLDWWAHAKLALAGALEQAGVPASEVAAVAVSSQAPCMVPLDAEGQPLRPALIWMDRRSDAQCEAMNRTLGEDLIFHDTGNIADPFYMFGELLWFKENEPELYDRTRCVLQCNGYVNYRLTGEQTIDCVHASITQCYDVRRHCWSEAMLSAFGVPASILPRVVDDAEIIGGVCAAAARETGIPAGTPVLGGSVDGVVAGLEGGVFGDGEAVEMTGTSSVLVLGTTEPHFSKKLTYIYGAIPGQHYLLGCMSTTGGALKWYRNTLMRGSAHGAYDRMNQLIEAECPEPTPLVFLPYMAGERAPIWDTHAKGAFLGITPDTREADMLRAMQEGATFALMDNLTEGLRAGADVRVMRAVGGHTHSDIWMKIKASVLNMPIEIPRQSYGAPGGLLGLLGYALGDYGSIVEACDAYFVIDRVVEPVARWVDWYRDQFMIFKQYYDRCRDTFRMADEMRAKR